MRHSQGQLIAQARAQASEATSLQLPCGPRERRATGPSRRAALARAAAWAVGAPLGLGSLCAAAQEARSQAPLPDKGTELRLPDVTLLNGSVFRAEQAQGKVTVLYWWASWCPFCAVQSPLIEKLWQANKARGLQVLALSIDKQREDAVKYLASKGYQFPAAMFTPELARQLAKPKGLPVTVVRGKDGRVAMAEAGQMFPEDVEDIARFLG